MTRRAFPWSRLGIDPTSDTGAIRKAYADVLRSINPDEDIAGFADLRRARDQALWLAARQADEAQDADADADEDEDEGELYGLGALDEADDRDPDWDDDHDDGGWDIAPAFTPGEMLAQAPELTEAQKRAQEAWNRLLDVLYPGGDFSEDAVTHAQLDEGLTALAVLTGRAEEADIEEHDALDGALADLFARTWPRSAPFVEPANAVFGWLDESGILEERAALRFLNQRLKGMRFHDKVLLPEHPLHKAWVELSRPGRAGVLDRLRVSRLDVHKLLVGLRERYPELESHLDPERVASWEGAGAGSGDGYSSAGRGFGGAVLFVVLFFALIRAIAALGGAGGGDADNSLPPPVPVFGPSEAEIDAAVAGVFGPGTDMAKVREADPVFADQLALGIRNAKDNGGTSAFVRHKALQVAELAKFEELVALGELKRIWLAAALKNPAQCKNVMAGDFRSLPLALGKDEAAREQELMRRLLDARLLSHRSSKSGGSFSVPGWAIDKMLKKSGLGIDELTAALKDPEHPKRCLVDLTMAEVILAEPGRVSAEVLRAL
ncbi:MAG: hypothetical protein NBV68_07340 [Erythrobacter sp.]|uniref:hypothetical protein n=1 Tax=Erythrobacter sp. TaxID=1042 RepID=UPI0025ED569A|nr:hypothetical protein [Erythrobacter sp.]MCL9999179.1 hypothetical protein [Erythrobacter sp.]